jgi:hypothetical protein
MEARGICPCGNVGLFQLLDGETYVTRCAACLTPEERARLESGERRSGCIEIVPPEEDDDY